MIPLLGLLCHAPMQAQVVFRHIDSSNTCYLEAYTMVPAADSGYLVSSAYNCLGGPTNWNGQLLRLNSRGDTLWTRNGLPASGFLRNSADGNYLFVGGNHAGLVYDTIIISKTNDHGDTVWTRPLFFAECNNLAYDLVNTLDGGYAACGIYAVNCSGTTNNNSFVVKLNSDGAVEWTTYLTGINNTELFVIRQLADSSYALFGWTDSYGAGLADQYLVRLNAHGDSIMAKTYGGPGQDYGYGMDILPGGGFITNGYSDSIYARKLDADGNVIWSVALGVPSGSVYFKAEYMPDRHYAFMGCESDTLGCSASLFKTGSTGQLIWKKNFGGLFRELMLDGPGTFLMAGYYSRYPAKDAAYYVRFDTTFDPLDTVKTGIAAITPTLPVRLKSNMLMQGQEIEVLSTSALAYQIEVYDLLGHKKLTQQGHGNITLNTAVDALAPGLYIWRAVSGGIATSGKLVVQ